MTDVIRIHDLRVNTRIGVGEDERAHPRGLLVNVELRTDTTAAGVSDDLADTINYHEAASAVANLVRSTEARLLEHLAERIAELLREMYGKVGVTVTVAKEHPPIEEDIQAVSVTIERDGGVGM
jgi:dihydroneopterin aldolase